MIKSCEDCGKEFKTSRHNSRWCDSCAIIRQFDPPKNKDGEVSRKYLDKTRDFLRPTIQKQWKKSSQQSMNNLLSKLSGTNYHN